MSIPVWYNIVLFSTLIIGICFNLVALLPPISSHVYVILIATYFGELLTLLCCYVSSRLEPVTIYGFPSIIGVPLIFTYLTDSSEFNDNMYLLYIFVITTIVFQTLSHVLYKKHTWYKPVHSTLYVQVNTSNNV